MKKIITAITLLSVMLISCSKKTDPAPVTPVVPPPDTIPVVTTSKLIKTAITSFGSGSSNNIDSFAYDNLKRVNYYSKYIPGKTALDVSILFQYQFVYTGNNNYPVNFTYTQKQITSTLVSETVMRDTLIYNADGKLITDSTVYTTLIPAYAVNKVKTYTYFTNLVVAKTIYPNINLAYPNNLSNQLDSMFYDGNQNIVQRISGTLDKNNAYTIYATTNSVYGSTASPFKTNAVGIINTCIYGIFPSKNLDISESRRQYSSATSFTTSTATMQWTTDAGGLLQKFDYTAGNPLFSSSTVYSYY